MRGEIILTSEYQARDYTIYMKVTGCSGQKNICIIARAFTTRRNEINTTRNALM